MRCVVNTEYPVIERARRTGRGNSLLVELIKAFVVMFIMICITGLLSDWIGSLIFEDVSQEPLNSIVILYGEIITIAVGVLYCMVFERRDLYSVGFSRPVVKEYGIGLAFGGLLISTTVLLGAVLGGFRFSYMNTTVSIPMQLLFFGGFMIQGMAEEVMFRGYMFVSMTRKNSILAATLGSSLLFGLIHIFNDGFSGLAMLNIVLVGVLESLLFIKTSSIWASGAVHSIWNYMQGCVYGLSVSGNERMDSFFVFEQTDKFLLNGGTFGPEGGVVVTAVIVVSIVFVLGTMRKDKEEQKLHSDLC